MRAAELKERPAFTLMKQSDIQSVYHMQMPRWLFSDPRYADMSLDAKVAYTFLLNRFQLSRKNGWLNDMGEVFVIFPRKALAAELRICEQRITAAFRQLTERKLVWEKRCGRGDANQIYLATVLPQENTTYTCAPFVEEDCGSKNAAPVVLTEENGQEPQDEHPQSHEYGGSRDAELEGKDPQELRPSYIDLSYPERIQKEVSPSVAPPGADWQTDEEALEDILDACELHCFTPETAQVFENAIERLFYADSLRIGNATLPQKRVRAKLRLLDGMILRNAESKMAANLEKRVKNSTAYTMSVIFNCITESESDLLIDPYLNSLRAPPGRC